MSFAWRLPWPYHYQTERSSLVMAFPRSLALLSPKLTLWPFCCLAELSWLYLLELPGVSLLPCQAPLPFYYPAELFISFSSSLAFLLPWICYTFSSYLAMVFTFSSFLTFLFPSRAPWPLYYPELVLLSRAYLRSKLSGLIITLASSLALFCSSLNVPPPSSVNDSFFSPSISSLYW